MDSVQLCEILMLVLFGFSWPFNIVKAWRSRTAKGKSIAFEVIILAGYVCGIIGKLITFKRTGNIAFSLWFYIADIVMVSTDLAISIRNRHLDKEREF